MSKVLKQSLNYLPSSHPTRDEKETTGQNRTNVFSALQMNLISDASDSHFTLTAQAASDNLKAHKQRPASAPGPYQEVIKAGWPVRP